MRSRQDLVEYLCSQQHAAQLLATACNSQTPFPGRPWSALPPEIQSAERAGMQAVLEELGDLGLLVSARVPA